MPTILITEHVHHDAWERLCGQPDFDVVDGASLSPVDFDAALRRADAIGVRIRKIGRDDIAAAANLKVIAKHGVGTDNIDLTVCASRQILVLNTPDANKVAVAEHAMAMMLAHAKRIGACQNALRNGNWRYRDALEAIELSGRTLGILGFGRSGQELARRARCFDMNVLAWGRTVDPAAAEQFGVRHICSLDEILRLSDVISLHTPRIDHEEYLIGPEQLALMKPDSFLVNCARGGLVDEAALAIALEGGSLAGAGIDVFEHEPPTQDHPLLRMANVVSSPHTAGNTREASRRMGLDMADNIIAGLGGRPDPARVVRAPTLSL